MTKPSVAVVGSGPSGAAVAYVLAKNGHPVTVFEKGPAYPYPPVEPFREEVDYLWVNPARELPADLRKVVQTGTYHWNLSDDLYQVEGGAGTKWGAIALRMLPSDFRTRTQYGYGADWPFGYDELEPYYCAADELMGTAGTDADNPFAPPRSRPFPMPPFELSYDDMRFAERLKAKGIVLHTTPQTRTRVAYDERPQCMNYGVCWVCPIGARYSPNHHLQLAAKTGNCKVITEATVRRVMMATPARARGLVYRINSESQDREHPADVVVLAGGAFETPRLLLLSKGAGHADGVGNGSGQVGRNLLVHHGYGGKLHYAETLYPGRSPFWTGQSYQFMDTPMRKRAGGVKVEFPFMGEPPVFLKNSSEKWKSGADVMRDQRDRQHWHPIRLHSEASPGPEKYLELSDERDRFGDPFMHIHYDVDARDRETYAFASDIMKRFADATGSDHYELADLHGFHSSVHHMGGCRAGNDPATSVTDRFCRVHGVNNLYVAGGAIYPTSGSVNPTLTMVAIALRATDHLMETGGV